MKKRLPIIIILILALIIFLFVKANKKPDYSGLVLRVSSSLDLSGGSYAEGAAKFAEEYGCTVEFTDQFEGSDLFFSSGENFSECQPITDYINPSSKLYTKDILRQSCTKDGEIYAITHALLGNINYALYRPSHFGGATLPYDYYKSGKWSWESFINMANEIGSNIAIDWTKSYINMQRALFIEDGKPTFRYGTQAQIEWLNFVRTLIYDDGIVNNTEGAYKVDFLPGLILGAVDIKDDSRYIPWPTKTGKLDEVFIDEYHFCVPKTAQNPEASVELANYMIKSCIDTRTELYRSAMTEEDYKLFEKQLKHVYTYPEHTDYVPASRFIDDFVRGKTVTEHIYNVENGAEHIN